MKNKKWALYGVCVCSFHKTQQSLRECLCLAHMCEWLEIFFIFLFFSLFLVVIILQNHFVISGRCYFSKPRVLLFKWFGGTRQLWVSRQEQHTAGAFMGHSCNLHQIFLNQEKNKTKQKTKRKFKIKSNDARASNAEKAKNFVRFLLAKPK